MNNSDIQKFIDKNKDNIEVIKNLSGTIISIKVKDKNKIDFTDTNCKLSKDWEKDVIVTNDGQKFDFNYPTKREVATAWMGRTFKNVKLYVKNFDIKNLPSDLSKLATKIDDVVRPVTDKLMGVDQPEIVKDPPKPTVTPIANSRATGPVANFGVQKNKSDDLTRKLDEILQKYEGNKKYANDPEIVAYRKRLNAIKERYNFSVARNDAAEMLNVKTKLVNLSGRIIAKQKSMETVKQKRVTRKRNTAPKPVPPETSTAVKKTPKLESQLKAARTRFINKYNKEIEVFDKTIGLYTSKASIYKSEIELCNKNLANIEQIAVDNNFDSRERDIYIKDQQEKITDMQAKLKEVEEQIRQEEEKKKAYNEEYVEVKYKNEFEPEGYIKKKEKRGYAYNYYMREINLEKRIKLNQEIKKDDEEIAAMEAKLNEMKQQRDAKVSEENKIYQNGSKNSEQLLSDSNPDLVEGFHRSM